MPTMESLKAVFKATFCAVGLQYSPSNHILDSPLAQEYASFQGEGEGTQRWGLE